MAKPLKLPDVLIVGPHNVSVWPLAPSEATAQDICGRYTPNQHRIEVREDMGTSAKRDTLLHETLHAVFDIYDLPANDEEAIVTRLTPALLALCRFNPGLKAVLFP